MPSPDELSASSLRREGVGSPFNASVYHQLRDHQPTFHGQSHQRPLHQRRNTCLKLVSTSTASLSPPPNLVVWRS
jgi:hypothetical protein